MWFMLFDLDLSYSFFIYVFIYFYILLLDYSPLGMVSSEQAECWRLFPHGLQCDHAFHNAEGEF